MAIDNDYETYARMFKFALIYPIDKNLMFQMEPSFFLIPIFSQFILPNFAIQLSFLIFAFFGVSTKMLSLKDADFFFLSVALYVSYLFFMQEMTTIRAGVAGGIFLYSIRDLVNKNDKAFFIKMLAAFFFHYSSILFVFIWLIIRLKISLKYYYILLFISFIIAVTKIQILHLLFLDVIFPKIKFYLNLMELRKEVKLNVFNFKILFSLFITILFIAKKSILDEKPFFAILFKIHLFSLALFFMLSPTAMVFSLRSYELLSSVQILLFPMVVYLFKERIIGFAIVFLFSIVQFYYIIYSSHLLASYKSWLF